MNKLRYISGIAFFALIVVMSVFSSCSEQDEVGEYYNWKARNQHFVDSIANVASVNADGSWEKIKAYSIGDSTKLYADKINYFIYVKKLEIGTGTTYPMYEDSVRVHYLGRLIPTDEHPSGYSFGKSYSTYVLNEETDVPTIFSVNRNIVGFATALMHMHVGDSWMVYVPYYLGYGESYYTSDAIPAYSTLVFEIKLAKIYRYKIDTDTAWH